MCILFLT